MGINWIKLKKGMNQMKKMTGLAAMLCVISLLCSCGDVIINNNNNNVSENNPSQAQLLSAVKNMYVNYELHEDNSEILAAVDLSYITLGKDFAEEYPKLDGKLGEYAQMQKNAVEQELENMLAAANEEVKRTDFENFNTYATDLINEIRRADSIVFSILADYSTDNGITGKYRALSAINIDSETGNELVITDVVKDMTAFSDAVKKGLTSHMWAGEFLSENAVEDYLTSSKPEDICWTLEYNGINVYFNAGTVAEEHYGILATNVSFAENAALFNEKYTVVPKSYSVGLPMNLSNFADIDGDGKLDEIILTMYREDEDDLFTEFGIATSCGNYYTEDFYTYGFQPYYIKTAEGRHLLYVFAQDADDYNRLMNLNVYDISGGNIFKLGEMPVSPAHDVNTDSEDCFSLPVNPEKMLLDYYFDDAGFRYPGHTKEYFVGNGGMPSYETAVESVEELLEAIAPNENIRIKSGLYNISDFIDGLTQQQINEWNESHNFVQIRECYDGYEIAITLLDNLTITGETENADETEIVTDPRYATVLFFEDCRNVYIKNLTLGHTDAGDCEGDVLGFSQCKDVFIDNTDLYGCGVYGIAAKNESGEFYVYDTIIRECSYGPINISGCDGNFNFRGCAFKDSDGYGVFEKNDDTDLYFSGCTFGKRETEHFMFRDDIFTDNCTWSEDIEYPEYGYEYTQLEEALLYFEPEIMEMIAFDEEDLEDTYWDGYMRVIQESGDTVTLPQYIEESDELYDIDVELCSDGTAYITYGTQTLEGEWYGYDNDDYSVCIALDEGHNAYVSLFELPDEEDAVTWMMLQLDENLVWLYRSL